MKICWEYLAVLLLVVCTSTQEKCSDFDIEEWLTSLSLPQYVSSFRENHIDGEFLRTGLLTLDVLKDDLRIGSFGHRYKIHNAIAAIDCEAAAPTLGRKQSGKDRAHKLDNVEPIRVHKNQYSFLVRPYALAPNFWPVYFGAWEPLTFTVFDLFCRPDKVTIDIGAWIGSTVLYSAQISSKVFALEPDPVAFSELRQNVEVNEDFRDRVSVHNLCISDKFSLIPMVAPADFLGGSGTSLLSASGDHRNFSAARTFSVPCVALADYIEAAGIADVGLIKIDTEGAEAIILSSSHEWIAANKPPLFVALHPSFWGKQKLAEFRRLLLKTVRLYKHVYLLMEDISEISHDDLHFLLETEALFEICVTDTAIDISENDDGTPHYALAS